MCGQAFHRGLDQVLDEGLAGVLAGAGAGLQDHRRAHLGGGGHHGLHLLEVVDVEGRDAVAVFGGVVEQLAHRDEWHGISSEESCPARMRADTASQRYLSPASAPTRGPSHEDPRPCRRHPMDHRRRRAARPGDLPTSMVMATAVASVAAAQALDVAAQAGRRAVAGGNEGTPRQGLCKPGPAAPGGAALPDLAGLQEDLPWSRDFAPFFALATEVARMAQHAFTELLNNAIDHSGGTQVTVSMRQTGDAPAAAGVR
jgi:hypothetical protein